MSKTITNYISGNSTTGSSSGAPVTAVPDFTASTIVTTVFYKNNSAGLNDQVFTYRLYKLGTLVWMVVKPVSINMVTTQRWVSSTVMPAAYRPAFNATATFHAKVGGPYQYDSDVLGMISVDTSGYVSIYREADPGTGEWNNSGSGWEMISAAWYTSS